MSGPVLQYRLPEEPQEIIAPCVAHNEAMDQAANDWALFVRLGQVPVGLQELHFHLARTAEPQDDESFQVMTWFLHHRRAWRCNL